MANSKFENVQGKKDFRSTSNHERSNSRGKFSGNRENGGFRIRLSDNEMQAVRSIQENFQLKSPVAVLGFSVRTLSELIKNSDLKKLVSQYAIDNRNQSKSFSSSKKNEASRKAPDPFARPTKSQPPRDNNSEAINIDE